MLAVIFAIACCVGITYLTWRNYVQDNLHNWFFKLLGLVFVFFLVTNIWAAAQAEFLRISTNKNGYVIIAKSCDDPAYARRMTGPDHKTHCSTARAKAAENEYIAAFLSVYRRGFASVLFNIHPSEMFVNVANAHLGVVVCAFLLIALLMGAVVVCIAVYMFIRNLSAPATRTVLEMPTMVSKSLSALQSHPMYNAKKLE